MKEKASVSKARADASVAKVLFLCFSNSHVRAIYFFRVHSMMNLVILLPEGKLLFFRDFFLKMEKEFASSYGNHNVKNCYFLADGCMQNVRAFS